VPSVAGSPGPGARGGRRRPGCSGRGGFGVRIRMSAPRPPWRGPGDAHVGGCPARRYPGDPEDFVKRGDPPRRARHVHSWSVGDLHAPVMVGGHADGRSNEYAAVLRGGVTPQGRSHRPRPTDVPVDGGRLGGRRGGRSRCRRPPDPRPFGGRHLCPRHLDLRCRPRGGHRPGVGGPGEHRGRPGCHREHGGHGQHRSGGPTGADVADSDRGVGGHGVVTWWIAHRV